MRRNYDVVVIGGGIMGLAIAREMRELGGGTVALLERTFLGAGSSGKSGAILRAHYSHRVTIRMARDSLQAFAHYAEVTGHDIGFVRRGMLFLVPETQRSGLETNVRLQQSEGVETSILDAAALGELDRRATTAGVVAAWEPGAAYVDPVRTVSAFGAEAARAGVEIHLGCPVLGLRTAATVGERRVEGVEIPGGCLGTSIVVAATGPWSPKLLAALDVELPLEVVRPQQAFVCPPADFGAPHPIVADLPNEIYYKPEAAWTRVGSIAYDQDERVVDPDSYDEGVSSQFLRDVRERLARRYPAYGRAVLWGGGSGLYTVTPDAHAVIGPVAGLGGFFLVTGFSGHGFKLAPAVGRGVAEWLVHGHCKAFDLGFFAPGRFAAAQRIATAYRYKILG